MCTKRVLNGGYERSALNEFLNGGSKQCAERNPDRSFE